MNSLAFRANIVCGFRWIYSNISSERPPYNVFDGLFDGFHVVLTPDGRPTSKAFPDVLAMSTLDVLSGASEERLLFLGTVPLSLLFRFLWNSFILPELCWASS